MLVPFSMPLTAKPSSTRFGVARTAFTTGHLAGRQKFRALLCEEGQGRRGVPGLHRTTAQRLLAVLDALPQRVADDAQFRRCDNSSLPLFCV